MTTTGLAGEDGHLSEYGQIARRPRQTIRGSQTVDTVRIGFHLGGRYVLFLLSMPFRLA